MGEMLERHSETFERQQVIMEFLYWLHYDRDLLIGERYEDTAFLLPTLEKDEDLVFSYFGIDRRQLDEERAELIAMAREMNRAKNQ